jgi:hypothetical protein
VPNNTSRCCSAFAHTPTSSTSLDPRCSALGCEPEASHNGQAIDAGQAAAPIHRIHHSNEHPVGCANIGRVRIPVSAACTALGAYAHYLPPPDACSRHKCLLASGRRRAHSVPPDHPKRKNEKNRSRTARGCHVVPVDIVANQTDLLEKPDKWILNNYEG